MMINEQSQQTGTNSLHKTNIMLITCRTKVVMCGVLPD